MVFPRASGQAAPETVKGSAALIRIEIWGQTQYAHRKSAWGPVACLTK